VKKFAVEIVNANFGLRVFQISENEAVVNNVGVLELIFPLRDNGFPIGALGMPCIDRNDAAAGSVEIGFDPEDGAVVIDKAVFSIEVVEQFDDSWARFPARP
jgi:hypothetical protein